MKRWPKTISTSAGMVARMDAIENSLQLNTKSSTLAREAERLLRSRSVQLQPGARHSRSEWRAGATVSCRSSCRERNDEARTAASPHARRHHRRHAGTRTGRRQAPRARGCRGHRHQRPPRERRRGSRSRGARAGHGLPLRAGRRRPGRRLRAPDGHSDRDARQRQRALQLCGHHRPWHACSTPRSRCGSSRWTSTHAGPSC